MQLSVALNLLSLVVMTCFWTGVAVVQMIIAIIRYRGAFFFVKKRPIPPEVLSKDWDHANIRLSDVSLHYVHAGDGGKPLMLFLHGFPEFWYSWRSQMRYFQSEYRVVAVDMRGYGDSDKPAGIANYDMEKLVKDVEELIKALGYSSCILVSHDWGGAVAWQFVLKHPEMVDKFIVHNCPHPKAFRQYVKGGSLKQMLKSWYMFFFQCPFLPEIFLRSRDLNAFDEMFTKGCSNPQNFTPDDIEAWKYTFGKPGAFTPPLNYYRSALRRVEPVREKDTSSTVQPPVLIIWGTNDIALETGMAKLSTEFCRQAQLELVKGASHFVQNDEPDICNELISKFLTGSNSD